MSSFFTMPDARRTLMLLGTAFTLAVAIQVAPVTVAWDGNNTVPITVTTPAKAEAHKGISRGKAASIAYHDVITWQCPTFWSCTYVWPLIFSCGPHSWCWEGTYIYGTRLPTEERSWNSRGRITHGKVVYHKRY
jgi:hypothetical protein